MCDFQESVATGQTKAGENDPYVQLCFTGDTTNVFVKQFTISQTPTKTKKLS